MSEFEAKIVASLDTADAEKQLKNLTEKEHEVKLKTDFNEKDTQKQFDETLKKTQKKTAKKPLEFEVKANSNDLIQLSDTANKLFSMFTGNRNVLDFGVDKVRESIGLLRDLNTILVEIDKTGNLSQTQLSKLADESYDAASKWGAAVQNYMSSSETFSQAGYSNLEEMSDLSMMAQTAGQMTEQTATNFLIASDNAWQMKGNVEKLTSVLDGMNSVTNHNALNMTELSNGIRVAGSMLANSGLAENQATALVGTGVATTKESGETVARGLRTIIMNLRQVKGEAGDGEIIDTDQLKKVEQTCKDVGVSLKTVKDGVVELRNPVDILRDLSEVYNSLDTMDARRAQITDDIGGKHRSNILASILTNFDQYDKMLQDYANGEGSAFEEAMKTANSWEGKLQSLQNTWLEFVNNFVQADAMKSGITFLDNMISAMDTLQNKQLFLPSMLSAIMGLQTAFTGKGIDIERGKNGKLDISGSLFGIDLSAMKESKGWKEHFKEAGTEIARWNKEVLSGQVSLEDFGGEFVKQNKDFKDYISGLDGASASLDGYKQHLTDTGVEFEKTFSAKSILANAATGLLVGAGVELSLAALTKVADELIFKQDQLQEKADTSASAYSSTVSEIESINSELATTQARIDELKAQDNKLLPGDEAELTRLEQQNALLQTQLDMKERLAESQAKGAAEAAKESIDYSSEKSLDTRMDRNGMDVVQNIDRKEYVRQRIAEMEKAQKQIDDTQKELNNKYISNDKRDMYERQFESAQANLEKYRKEATEMLSELNSESENFYDKQTGQILGGYEDDVKAITELNNALNNFDLSPIEQQMQSINSYFDGSTTSNIIKEQLLEAVQSGESATDALHAMGVTLNDLGITGEGKKAVFDDYFRGLVNSAEQAEEAVKSIDGTVDGVKSAFESENQDANWKSMADALKQADDLYKESKIGTDDFQSAVQFIAPKEINPDDTKFDAQAYVKAYEKYKDKIKRYFDSEDEKKSAANLQNDLIDKGLAKQTDNGIDWVLSKFKTSADAAKAWGISVEAAEVAMRSLEAYGAEFDNVTFSTENLNRYQSALEQIKGIYDSMDDNSEGKERLKNIIDQSEIDDFENNLDNLTEDKVINIEFEYDLASVQQQIDEIKNSMTGSGGTTEEYMSLISSQKKKRDMLAERKGMSKATSDDGYASSLTAFDNLAQKLTSEYDTLGESGRRAIQQQQSALLDLQNSYLDMFQRGDVADWDSFFNTKEAENIIKDLAKDTGKSVDNVKDELAQLTGVDTSNADKDVEINLKANDEATPQIDKVLSFATEIPQEIITELLAEDKASDHAINVLSAITGIPEETLVKINADDGASGILSTVVSQITGIPESKVTELLATDNVSGLASLVMGSIAKIPNKHKTSITATDSASSKANAAKAAVNSIPSSKHITIGGSISSTLTNAVAAAKAKIASVGGGGGSKLNGTAHKEGTANSFAPKKSGHAFASGTIEDDSWINDKWKTKKDEVALTGEVGQEMIVHGNTWQTVGDNGAEFAHIPAGSVVFNAKQTEELLKKGSILSRGKALLSGTISRGKAFLRGTAFANGMPLIGSSSKKKSSKSSSKSDTRYNKKASKKKSKKAAKDAKKAKETFDWIEIAINRIERSIDRLDLKASSAYRAWSDRNANLKSEISNVGAEITKQQQGYNRYIKEANSVGLASKWKKKVQNGTIDISTVKDEKLAEKIKEYQQW